MLKKEEREERKESFCKQFEILASLGETQKTVSCLIGVSEGFTSHVLNPKDPVYPSEETVQDITDLAKEKQMEMAGWIFKMSPANVQVIETCNAANVKIDDTVKQLLGKQVFDYLSSLIAGKPEHIEFPDGVLATLGCIGEMPNCIHFIALKTTDDKKVEKKILAHELNDLGDAIKRWARKLDPGSGRSSKPSRKAF